jgi:predicted MPP superfamily phosphohydrolase
MCPVRFASYESGHSETGSDASRTVRASQRERRRPWYKASRARGELPPAARCAVGEMATVLPIKTFRNPILSLWQSALHKTIAQSSPQAARRLSSEHPWMAQSVAAIEARVNGQATPRTDRLGAPIGECAGLAADLVVAAMKRDRKRVATLENELKGSACDPGWFEALETFLAWEASSEPIPYVRHKHLTDFVLPLPGKQDLAIAFLADWGTGAEDAAWILSEVMKRKPDVLVHLGDIYYSGTQEEVQNNFLSLVRARAPGIPVFTLSGNHDMYSGGRAYYGLLEQLGQPPSYFCLRSAGWQFLAMDTGLHDCDPITVDRNVTFLEPSEIEWHLDKLRNSGGRRTVLLSHHQLFTSFDTGTGRGGAGKQLAHNPKLREAFGDSFDQIELWLWGHEHNLEIFLPYVGLRAGRCIGASAIPRFAEENPYQPNMQLDLEGESALPALDRRARKLSLNRDGVYDHSFVILTLAGPAGPGRD